MRTTLDLPDDLLEEARRLLGFKSKTDTIVLSLTELVRRRRIDELKALAGAIKLELDVGRSRRRPTASWSKRDLTTSGAPKAGGGRPRRRTTRS
ncbi:MAG TPA: type II toxin-antitoxin system VapB family antitoxin [Polyangiaceae bacterium]|jgi:Arc/MetJ family transcription regulator